MDALCVLLDCGLGISPVTSYSGVTRQTSAECRPRSLGVQSSHPQHETKVRIEHGRILFHLGLDSATESTMTR